jgi:transcriptional regulator with XRE-family HTH domain
MKRKSSLAQKKKSESKTLWQVLKELRKDQGLSQEAVAEAFSDNADAPWISRVEAGKKKISFATALRLVNVLGGQIYVNNTRIKIDE